MDEKRTQKCVCSAVETLCSAYSRPILTVFGKFEPLSVVGHRSDSACFEPLCVKIRSRVTFVSEPENKNKKKFRVILHVFGQTFPYNRLATSWTILTIPIKMRYRC